MDDLAQPQQTPTVRQFPQTHYGPLLSFKDCSYFKNYQKNVNHFLNFSLCGEN
jgi:hypothetical protein